jgi:hypothetical protein
VNEAALAAGETLSPPLAKDNPAAVSPLMLPPT